LSIVNYQLLRMRILGIDPGLNITGYGVLEKVAGTQAPKLLEGGVVRGGGSDEELSDRLREIHNGIAEVITAHQPNAVAIEQLYSHYEHPRTSILMGHARGVIVLAAALARIPVFSYNATQIKKNVDRQRPRAEAADAASNPAGAEAGNTSRTG
jgi:crossover junction endodeoxyribonuclease RuvC